MAGIKETKDRLKKEILELYKRFTASSAEQLFSGEENEEQLHEQAEIAAQLAKKIAALANLVAVEESKEQIFVAIPELTPSIPVAPIAEPIVEKIYTPIPEIVRPEIHKPAEETVIPEFQINKEKSIPPVHEITIPDLHKTNPVNSGKAFPEMKTFIGFNEKLMFLRSLFNGDTVEYDVTIAELNNSNSLAEANKILENAAVNYKWSKDSEPVQIFHTIVKRRFA